MLGKGSGIVSMKKGIATEESVSNNVCVDRIVSLCSVCVGI